MADKTYTGCLIECGYQLIISCIQSLYMEIVGTLWGSYLTEAKHIKGGFLTLREHWKQGENAEENLTNPQ